MSLLLPLSAEDVHLCASGLNAIAMHSLFPMQYYYVIAYLCTCTALFAIAGEIIFFIGLSSSG